MIDELRSRVRSAAGRAELEEMHRTLDQIAEAVVEERRLRERLAERLDVLAAEVAEQVAAVVDTPSETKDD